MSENSAFRDELQALKSDLSRLASTAGEELFDASRSRAEAVAGHIREALDDLGSTLEQQEDHIEKLISNRPIASLASAFALGIVVGLMLRKH
jgi:ElaB/YqjD/DUF883 family membrane-anchored ribosome-binding protein